MRKLFLKINVIAVLKVTIFSNMEIPFAADHTAVKKNGISMLLVQYILWYFMEFDVRSEVSFSSTESVDRFLSC